MGLFVGGEVMRAVGEVLALGEDDGFMLAEIDGDPEIDGLCEGSEDGVCEGMELGVWLGLSEGLEEGCNRNLSVSNLESLIKNILLGRRTYERKIKQTKTHH